MIEAAIDFLESVLSNAGPDIDDYGSVVSAFDVIHRHEFAIQRGVSTRTQKTYALDHFLSSNKNVFRSTATVQGFAYAKPHGYSGDFEIIEKIYHRAQSGIDHLKKWDKFFHEGNAPNAVRNRSAILAQYLEDIKPSNVLSVGCGPALDVSLAVQRSKISPIFSFLDNDANAIARAKVNTTSIFEDAQPTHFYHRNALRFRTDERFNMIWSSGLFDYLNDKTAIFLLKRLKSMLSPSGFLIVGNFSNYNPSRSYMEIVGEWFLIHRSEEDLLTLATEAGFRRAKIEIATDETNVGLFLVAHGG